MSGGIRDEQDQIHPAVRIPQVAMDEIARLKEVNAELLAMCRAVVDFWTDPPSDLDSYGEQAKQISDQLKSVIVKAEGRST